jgi:hypothetical protein
MLSVSSVSEQPYLVGAVPHIEAEPQSATFHVPLYPISLYLPYLDHHQLKSLDLNSDTILQNIGSILHTNQTSRKSHAGSLSNVPPIYPSSTKPQKCPTQG